MTSKQKEAARKNIKKAHDAWIGMSKRQRTLAQPQGAKRAKVGTKGEGQYYRIVVRPKSEFKSFRYHDVGDPGKILRLAGRRTSGSWDDHAWLIDKEMAYLRGDKLIGDTKDAKDILSEIGPVKHIKGDIFKGHPIKNVPESEKPTPAMKKAWKENIKKAQATTKKTP